MNFAQFCTAMQWWKEAEIKEKLAQVFDILDADGDGRLGISDLVLALRSNRPDWSDRRVMDTAKSLIKFSKTSGEEQEGDLTIEEFFAFLRRIPRQNFLHLLQVHILPDADYTDSDTGIETRSTILRAMHDEIDNIEPQTAST